MCVYVYIYLYLYLYLCILYRIQTNWIYIYMYIIYINTVWPGNPPFVSTMIWKAESESPISCDDIHVNTACTSSSKAFLSQSRLWNTSAVVQCACG